MSSQVSCGLLLQKSFRLPGGPLKSGLHLTVRAHMETPTLQRYMDSI